jgi:hypothetical protein
MRRLVGAAVALALSGTAGVVGAADEAATDSEVHRADPVTGITVAFSGMDAKDHAGYGYVVVGAADVFPGMDAKDHPGYAT